MSQLKQIDCFKINMKFWKLLAIWPSRDMHSYYRYYQIFFIAFFTILNNILTTINFFYLPRQLDVFIEEMIFYFTELAVTSKVLTFLFMHKKIENILIILESDMFQPKTEDGLKIIDNAKKFNVRYWKIVASVSATSHLSHILSPLIMHFIFHVKLDLPVCSFSFLSEDIIQMFIYPLYWYQASSMHAQVLYNINIDTYFLGILIYTIAQLDILHGKLQNTTDKQQKVSNAGSIEAVSKDYSLNKLIDSIMHYEELGKFCNLIQEVLSVTMFVQFSVASCIICVCLFRFTLPAPWQYFIFLGSYMFIMIIQILVPCWFATRIEDKSQLLSQAVYNCNWTAESRYFKSSLRLFVERANKSLSIVAGKMFPLSLTTFTSIMNSSYSFFTLLRHMQSRPS